MPEGISPLASSLGEELRPVVTGRQNRLRKLTLALAAGTAAPAAGTAFWKAPALLVWNSSASAPIGLYRVERRVPVRRGDMIVAWAPRAARLLAAKRHYLPTSVPLIKRVAAGPGDRVCALANIIKINRTPVTRRLERDSRGRPMPWWSGCRTLGLGEYFLLMASPQSFDGRYFGITNERELVGRAVLLWAR